MKTTKINFEIDKTSYLREYKDGKTSFYVIVTPSKKPNIISDNVTTITKKQFYNFNKKGIPIRETRGTNEKHLQDSKLKFVVHKTFNPYDEKGKPAFKIRNKPGVYLIYQKSKKTGKNIVKYVGFSRTDLYKTMYRHLQSWADPTQYRATFNPNNVTIKVIYTDNGTTAKRLEGALILKYSPIRNINKYDGFILDEKEKAMIKDLEETQPGIYTYSGDLPF